MSSERDDVASSRTPKRQGHYGAVITRAARPAWKLPLRYTLQGVEQLGGGSSGEVWEAWDSAAARMVAVKHVSQIFEHLVEGKRTLREVSILRRLKNAHILQLHDVLIPVGSDLGNFSHLFLVFDLCDRDLRKFMKNMQPLQEKRASSMFRDILLGLRYLHKAGVIHRDLKPANCLMRGDLVCLGDFGLSRPYKQAGNMQKTQTYGTSSKDASPAELPSGPPPFARQVTQHVVARWYRAPEVMLTGVHYTAAVDIWAAGCIFGELLQLVPKGGPVVPLFPGSGSANTPQDFGTEPDTDMLLVILRVLSTPPEADLEFLGQEAKSEVATACEQLDGESPRSQPTKRLREFTPHASEEAMDLLQKCLTFAAHLRPSAVAALEHPSIAPLIDASTAEGQPDPTLQQIDVDFEVSDQELLQLNRRQKFQDELRRQLVGEINNIHDLSAKEVPLIGQSDPPSKRIKRVDLASALDSSEPEGAASDKEH